MILQLGVENWLLLEKRKYFVEFDGNKFEKWVQCTDKKKYSVEVHQEVAVGSDGYKKQYLLYNLGVPEIVSSYYIVEEQFKLVHLGDNWLPL